MNYMAEFLKGKELNIEYVAGGDPLLKQLVNPVDFAMMRKFYDLSEDIPIREMCYVCSPEEWEWMKQSILASEENGKKIIAEYPYFLRANIKAYKKGHKMDETAKITREQIEKTRKILEGDGARRIPSLYLFDIQLKNRIIAGFRFYVKDGLLYLSGYDVVNMETGKQYTEKEYKRIKRATRLYWVVKRIKLNRKNKRILRALKSGKAKIVIGDEVE